MRATLILSVVLAMCVIASAKPLWHELESTSYGFQHYVRDFSRKYATTEEHLLRKAIFDENLAEIKAHNAAGHSWKMGVNQFTDMTNEEFARILLPRYSHAAGAAQRNSLTSKRHSVPAELLVPDNSLPTDVDWRKRGFTTPVKDQGHCGSCWIFGSVSNLESHLAISTGALVDLSVQQGTSCIQNPNHCGGGGGCEGGIAELVYDYVAENGLTSEFQYGYTSYYGSTGQCLVNVTHPKPIAFNGGYVELPSNLDGVTPILNALANVGPLTTNIQADGWKAYESGVFSGCADLDNVTINHLVQIIGYGYDAALNAKYYTIRNSWGLWGESGTIRLLRRDKEICGLDRQPASGVACDGQNATMTVCGTCGVLFANAYPTKLRLA